MSPEALIGAVLCIRSSRFLVCGVERMKVGGWAIGRQLVLMNTCGERFRESWGFILHNIHDGLITISREQADVLRFNAAASV